MGIAVEFNPDLALRDISEFKAGRRKIEECIPEKLEEGKVYDFFKKEQRIYYLKGEVSLIETTTTGGSFSKSHANVNILEVTHFIENGEVCTKGKYQVVEVFDIDKNASFEKCSMVKK
ncbi:MAG: hypothetical protein ACD_9C00312G0003 [uncultured bacterium]|nr:MAG: hypothetical protein ACD_9C00312G0003 [uncultured bacterium]KKQ44499.1 MAG: hypothetical protein US63_C0026G0018 [Candidatus Moranbacteria bacterium GW2011_GWC2_37_8]KKQ62901.1 MAG: hypothetical protein US82_C0004G0018 [Parcubacteria group bacterium GW2011_GWC1_38_22]KKQ81469.1 MAG: hypothetical protein UT03_C0001G0009 [Candidatus Moranbacteria bacterium GW2011_GWD2_38_7]